MRDLPEGPGLTAEGLRKLRQLRQPRVTGRPRRFYSHSMEKDPLDVALDIKRGFARIVASRDRPAGIDADYLIGVAVWWFVAFAAGSIAGFSVWPAAIVASLACWFWPVILLFDRGDRC